MNEIEWRSVIEFPQYVVSDKGDVKHFLYNRPLRPRLKTNGHNVVEILDVDGKYYTRTIGSLVAAAFLGPSDSVVAHINGDRTDNRVENLQYKTRSEIQLANHRVGTRQTKKVRNRETGEIYHSIAECARQLGVNSTTVSSILTGRIKKSRLGVQIEYLID